MAINKLNTPDAQTSESVAELSHTVPADQPNRVFDVASKLLGAYTVHQGQAHLAGCTMDEVPVARWASSDGSGHDDETCVILGPADPEGKVVDVDLYETLGLRDVTPTEPPPTVSPRELDRLARRATQTLHTLTPDRDAPKEARIELIWCKYARGKIQFTIGESTASVSFSGWARELAAPPFHCDVTGSDSMAIAATSDHRIVAADQIGTCERSDQRLPLCELVPCEATGQTIARNLATRCPVTHTWVEKDAPVECPMCRQRVSPQAITSDRCAACRQLERIRPDDTRLIRILGRYPQLATWTGIRMAETDEVYILTAHRWFERRLTVLDKTSLDVRHAARCYRLTFAWTDLMRPDAPWQP